MKRPASDNARIIKSQRPAAQMQKSVSPDGCVHPMRLLVTRLSGEEVPLFDHAYCIPRPWEHVKPRHTIRDLFLAVSRAERSGPCYYDGWPVEWIRLAIGDQTFSWPHRLFNHWGSDILLDQALMTFRQANTGIIAQVSYGAPRDYQDPEARGLCLCNFGGCCKRCNVPTQHEICSGCGNNGCCRCNDCGCHCCTDGPNGFQPKRLCPFSGCKPLWDT